MTYFIPSPHIAKTRIAHWSGLGFALVALARQVLCLIRRGDARGEAAAREFCALTLAAHLALMQELAQRGDDDSPDARQLHGIAKCLALLAFYAQSLLRRALERAAAWLLRARPSMTRKNRTPHTARRTIGWVEAKGRYPPLPCQLE